VAIRRRAYKPSISVNSTRTLKSAASKIGTGSPIRAAAFSLVLACLGAFALLAGGASAAPPCQAGSVAGQLDYAGDVYNFRSSAQEPGHDDYDIVEMRSCRDGPDIVLGLRVAGAIDADHAEAFYGFVLYGSEAAHAESLFFTNGSASYRNSQGKTVSLANETSGAWLTLRSPAAAFPGTSNGWSLKASAGIDTDSDDAADYKDWCEGSLDFEFAPDGDIAAATTPFGAPTMSISSLDVATTGSQHTLTVKGTTTGSVGEVRVSMGLYAVGITVNAGRWKFSDYWFEESLSEGDPAVLLARGGSSWAEWTFTRSYDNGDLLDLFYYCDATARELKVEARAISGDGSWGHVNGSFQPPTLNFRCPPSMGRGGGGSTAPAVAGASPTLTVAAVAVAGAGVLAAALWIRKRKKASAPAPAKRHDPPR